MKKTYVQFDENGKIETCRYGSGAERFALYSGVDQLCGGWLMETSGDFVTLETLEEMDNKECAEMIAAINEILSSESTEWEELAEEDREYIADFLMECGIE